MGAIGFGIGFATGIIFTICMFMTNIDKNFIVKEEYMVKNGYATYDENRSFVVKDEFKIYYGEE